MLAAAVFQQPGQGLENVIAHIVPPGVVHLLEMVQVDNAETQGPLFAKGPGDFPFQHLIQPAAVVEPRQGVADGLLFQRPAQFFVAGQLLAQGVLHLLQLGHIPETIDIATYLTIAAGQCRATHIELPGTSGITRRAKLELLQRYPVLKQTGKRLPDRYATVDIDAGLGEQGLGRRVAVQKTSPGIGDQHGIRHAFEHQRAGHRHEIEKALAPNIERHDQRRRQEAERAQIQLAQRVR